jgi:penicillin amidase
MLRTHWPAALVLFALPGTAAAPELQAPELAAQVTIHRDRWGVAHVVGKTDAATGFGFGYAQAEDNWPRLEENYLRSLGRYAEVAGPAGVAQDRLNRVLEIPRLAREEYARLDPRMRGLVDGFAAGINWWLARNPALLRRLARVEPWHPLAFIRYNYFQTGFARSTGIASGEYLTTEQRWDSNASFGSNGWVINPSRSASGHALLFINPHLPFYGPGQVYEGHVMSEEGWNFTGYTRLGFPLPYVGHNERLGWVSTDNAADLADLYTETFDDPNRPLAYRYGDGYRMATEWTDTLRVRRDDGSLEPRVLTLRKTHHGPIVANRAGRPLALRMAKLDGDGWLAEWYAMTRARSVAELKDAMRPLNMLFGNAMAADADGNTYYVYNGAVPRRDPSFDWTRPVEGRDPRTEWSGYHAFDELPQLTNPVSGWMQNCNGTPFLLTDVGNPEPARFPNYMVREGDTRRAMRSRALLASTARWTFEAWERAAFDTYAGWSDSTLPVLFRAWDAPGAADAHRELAPMVAALQDWDRRGELSSVAATLFARWRGQRDRHPGLDPLAALDSAARELTRVHGTWQVRWGDVNRLQRWLDRAGAGPSDSLPSLPVPGLDPGDGAVFTFTASSRGDSRRQYGFAGGTYVSVVEFGPVVRGRAVHVFGQSGNPASPHFADQAPLYAAGRLREVPLRIEEVRQAAVRTYRPGVP